MTDTAAVPATIDAASSSTAVAVPDDADYMVGLEDFDESDIVMPTIKIEHTEGVFVDSLSNEKFDTLECVILGLVKNRVMWAAEVKDDEPPLCQSLDFEHGRPGKEFPWSDPKVGFTPDTSLPEGEQPVLSCAACPLKDWGTHPTRDVPWCSEAHTFVIAIRSGEGYAPAVLTVKSSAIKGSKAYLSSFVRAKSPTFVCHTSITLDVLKRGSVTYSVPKFTRGEATDPDFHADFIRQFRTTRAFLHTPRSVEVEVSEGAAPQPAAATASAEPDEMPF